MNTEQTYPKPTTDDFFFLDDTDEAMCVETKKYENGNEVKRITLSSGKVAVVRELKAWEIEESSRLHQNDKEKYIMAIAALATAIDNEKVIYEDLRQMKGKDWTKIKYAVASTNF
jgi:hypothetical protein